MVCSMWTLLIVVGIVLLILWWIFFRMPTNPASSTSEVGTESDVEPYAIEQRSVRRVIVAEPVDPVDLRRLEGTSCAVVGVSYWVKDVERRAFNGQEFYLRREPSNKHDENAVAVYAGERKFGYLSKGMAARYEPLLAELGEEFVVTRDLSRPRLSFLLPRVPELRKMAKP